VLHRPWIRKNGVEALVAEIERVTDGAACYLTFDIDSVDPAYAPGTGTPVVDGLTPHEVFDTLRALTKPNIVGMDVVEISPPYDPTEVTALFGASVVLEYLCTRAALKPPKV
jgi:agmatinase